jgi:hypothetical protein
MDPAAPKRPRDTNQLAKRIVEIATGEVDETPTPEQARARKAGKAGGRARANALTPERRAEIARQAAEARWGKD